MTRPRGRRSNLARRYTSDLGLAGSSFAQPPLGAGGFDTLLDLSKVVSFAMSVLSLCTLLDTAFFIPATRWEDRLVASVARAGFAGCICLISGVLFHLSEPRVPLARTLPVRLFVWALTGYSLLFALGWYLDAYYVPLLWRNLPP